MSGRLARELEVAQQAARAAAAEILRVGPSARVQKADGSPVTAADLAANETICAILQRAFPDDGLLSEETADGPLRLGRDRVWIVDPLDGTRDFVAGTGQYAVHVALAIDGRAELGVVAEPAAGRTSWAVRGQGAFMIDSGGVAPLAVSRTATPPLRVGTSRFAATDALRAFLDEEPPAQAVPMGASTKLMALARGELDACVWLSGAEKEWDTCAPSVIVSEAGGCITSARGAPFAYNKADVVHHDGIIASNGLLHEPLLTRARAYLAGSSS